MKYQFSEDVERIEHKFKIKNGECIYIIPTALDKPVKMVIENQPIKNKEEYNNSILKLLENIFKINGIKQ